jgi:hypothetical protein
MQQAQKYQLTLSIEFDQQNPGIGAHRNGYKKDAKRKNIGRSIRTKDEKREPADTYDA